MIEINNVTKNYIRGGFLTKKTVSRGVQNLSLNIPRGAYGLLGINGAGKSTTLKMIGTLLRPTAGTITIDGKDSIRDEKALRKEINMITGSDRMLYYRLTGLENLLYFSSLYNLTRKEAYQRSLELLELTGLLDAKDKRVEEYSRGMKQRLAIARGLINDPKVLLLDEPTLGLDVSIAKEIRSFIKEVLLKDKKRIVILTSHYMNEIEDICSDIGILEEGKLIYNGDFKGLYNRLNLKEQHHFSVEKCSDKTLGEIKNFLNLEIKSNNGSFEIQLEDEIGFRFLKELNKFPLSGLSYSQVKPGLEEAVLQLSRR